MRFIIFLVAIICNSILNAQTITEYRYWFDNDINSGQIVPGSFGNDATISTALQIGTLTSGLHTLHFSAKQSDGKWSSVISDVFYNTGSGGASGYEYWFDTAYSSKKTVLTPSTNNLIITAANLNASGLKNGFHQLNIRFKPNGGMWSGVQSEMFFKRGNAIVPAPKIVTLKYWFDDHLEESNTVSLGILNQNTINNFLDTEEGLSIGMHQLCYQVKENGNLWSPIMCDSFNKTVNEYTLKIYPKILINKSNYSSGETIQLSGLQFVQNSQTNIQIRNSFGEIVYEYKNASANNDGILDHSLSLPSNLKKDLYFINAIDITNLHSSNIVPFSYNTTLSNQITITYPITQSSGFVNNGFNLTWHQKAEAGESIFTINSNYVGKTYKLEYSIDNGVSWIFIKNYLNAKCVLGNENAFSQLFVPTSTGSYIFKITDLNNSLNFTLSAPIQIDFSSNEGVYTIFQWDKSSPAPEVNVPKGLAADSVSKFLIKLNKKQTNNHTIKSVIASIEPIGGGIASNSTRLLGRISFANNPNNYTLEADNQPPGNPSYANSTSVTYPANQSISIDNNNLYFWLCSPVDYALNSDDLTGIRKIRVKFTVSYVEPNVPDEIHYTNEIEIVRPPLLFVHGINSDDKAFGSSAHFNIANSGDIKFADLANKIWPKVVFADLDPGGSFEKNGKILLGQYINQENEYYYNSFQSILSGMHNMGFACNRSDYVGHSMGGCVARTAISLPGYKPSVISTAMFKNYDRGFINKLITVNTPHEGSPIADLVDYLVNEANTISPSDLASLDAYGTIAKISYRAILSIAEGLTNGETPSRIPFLEGFLIKDNTSNSLGFPKYISSPALKNLRANDSKGQLLQDTYVKNHLIAGQIFSVDNILDIQTDFTQSQEFENNKLGEYLELLQKIVDQSKNLNVFTNNPEFKKIIKDGSNMEDLFQKINLIFAAFQAIDFVLKSDFVVPISSQIPDKNINTPVDITFDQSIAGKRSIVYGLPANHIAITNQLATGNRIVRLLNASLLDTDYFENYIPANSGSVNSELLQSMTNSNTTLTDSSIFRFGSEKIKIVNPVSADSTGIDSIININLKIFDTVHLKQIGIIYQGTVYNSLSKDSIQYFKIKNKPVNIGPTDIVAFAVYDSLNYTLKYYDAIMVNLTANDSINTISVNPKALVINPGQYFRIPVLANTNLHIATVSYENNHLNNFILDTNIVIYDTLIKRFKAKSNGNTRVVFQYGSFSDTAYIYISDVSSFPTLPLDFVSFNGNISQCNNINLQWQTSKEVNNKGFEVEQSINGATFNSIAFIKNTNTEFVAQKYQYQVVNVASGNYYYRIKQLDNDGKFSYSPTIVIKINCNNTGITVVPNPASTQITLLGLNNTRKHDFQIFDNKGSLIKTIIGAATNIINIKDIPNGLYLLKVDNNENLRFLKM